MTDVKKKYYPETVADGIFGAWFLNYEINGVTWTLAIEMWGSFFVFLLAETVVFYQMRWTLYLWIIFFLYLTKFTDAYKLTNYHVHWDNGNHLQFLIVKYFPLFTFGVIFSDIEHLTKGYGRPLDGLRNLNFWVKIPINLAFIAIFIIFGGLAADATVKSK